LDTDPRFFMIPVTIAPSRACLLPNSTGPNAVGEPPPPPPLPLARPDPSETISIVSLRSVVYRGGKGMGGGYKCTCL
jgi:hypothetical protein